MDAPKALVADDEPYVVTLLSRVLGKNGWEVITASSHSEAASTVQKSPEAFRLVILDVEMPGPPVEETITTIRAAGFTGGLYVSSGMTAGERKESIESMIDGAFLTKPYDPHLLAKRVESWKTTTV